MGKLQAGCEETNRKGQEIKEKHNTKWKMLGLLLDLLIEE